MHGEFTCDNIYTAFISASMFIAMSVHSQLRKSAVISAYRFNEGAKMYVSLNVQICMVKHGQTEV